MRTASASFAISRRDESYEFIALRCEKEPPPREAGRRRVLTRTTGEKDETEFHLTIPVTSSTIRTPASLRSDLDWHRIGTSDRDQIGIADRLHRNQEPAR